MTRKNLAFLFWTFICWTLGSMMVAVAVGRPAPAWFLFLFGATVYGIGWLLSGLKVSIRRNEGE